MSTAAIILLILALSIGVSSKYILKKNDSLPEEVAEQFIEEQTGLDIDFSPGDEEK